MGFRPRFRPEVRVETDEDGVRLVDGLTGLRIGLDPETARVTRRIDGRPLRDLAGDDDPAEVEAVVRRYLLLHLLEGAGTETVARLRAHRQGTLDAPLSLLREGRFACQESGDCCRSFRFGPLSADEVARIEALDLAGAGLGEGPWFRSLRGPDGALRVFLAGEERCVFQREDARCGLHAAFGAEAKPRVCRLFPYTAQATVAGLKLYDKGACSCFSRSATQGTPVTEDLERLLPLLGSPELEHPTVFVGRGLAIDFGAFLRLQRVLVREAGEGEASAPALLARLAARARGFGRAAAACPLEAGEPERGLGRALEEAPPPLPTSDDAPEAVAELCAALVARLAVELAAGPQGSQSARRLRQIGELLPLLHLVESQARAAAGGRLEGPYRALRALPWEAAVDELLRIGLRQRLFGRQALVAGRVRAGFLRLALYTLLVLYGGRQRAAAEGAPAVLPRHLDAGHAVTVRLLFHPELEELFLTWEAWAWPVCAALGAVLGG